MRGPRDWNKTRSTHARVLESLESVIAKHPSGLHERGANAAADDESDETRGRILDLRPRLIRASTDPDSAA